MKLEQINIAISEHLGEERPAWCCVMHGEVPMDRVKDKSCPWCLCPVEWDGKDYSSDLNAIAEAFRTLGDARGTYLMWVRDLYPLCPIEAPARIRAEAYCRAAKIGKWKEAE